MIFGTSLVAQWLRIRPPKQGTRVRALVWQDPTCGRATKPLRHNYWACALEPTSQNYWARVPQLLKPACSRALMLQLLSSHAATTELACCNYWARMLQLLSSHAATTEAHVPTRALFKRSHRNEKPAHCKEEKRLLAATRESPRAATKTQRSQNKEKKVIHWFLTLPGVSTSTPCVFQRSSICGCYVF